MSGVPPAMRAAMAAQRDAKRQYHESRTALMEIACPAHDGADLDVTQAALALVASYQAYLDAKHRTNRVVYRDVMSHNNPHH